MMSDVLSAMEETNPKNMFASAGERGMKPTSSITTSATLRIYLSLLLLTPDILSVLRYFIRLSRVSKATL